MPADKPPDELAAKRKAPRKRPPNRAETSAESIEARKRERDAVALRLAGASLPAIAEQVGYASHSGAHAALKRVIKEMVPQALREEYLEWELARIDRLQAAHWPAALNGNHKSAAVVQRCIDTRIRLLGLEAPRRLDMTVADGTEVQIDVLQVLDDQTMAAALELRRRQHDLAELRAGAIDVEAIEETPA